jgi:hypothetical protein
VAWSSCRSRAGKSTVIGPARGGKRGRSAASLRSARHRSAPRLPFAHNASFAGRVRNECERVYKPSRETCPSYRNQSVKSPWRKIPITANWPRWSPENTARRQCGERR